MAFDTKEQEIIKYGIANGKTKEQVTQAITNYRTGMAPKQPSVSAPAPTADTSMTAGDIMSSIGTGLKNFGTQAVQGTVNAAKDAVSGLKGDVQSGAQAITDSSNGTMNPIAAGGRLAVRGGIGTISDLAKLILSPITGTLGAATNNIAGAVSEIPAVQKFANTDVVKGGLDTIQSLQDGLKAFETAHPEASKALFDTINVAMIAAASGKKPSDLKTPEVLPKKSLQQQNYETAVQMENSQIMNAGENTLTGAQIDQMHVPTQTFAAPAAQVASKPIQSIASQVGQKLGLEPALIMNRVARLKPTDAVKFENMAGKSQGQYLSETGNFGTPDSIIKNEATKFAQSKGSVDTELAKLPGTYKDGAITDALSGLLERAKQESSNNVKSPYLAQVQELVAKNKKEGLTMAEINDAKRLYEKNVKLGYKGVGAQMNPAEVTKATNIDSALRNWQVAKAKELGFSNISELNKQTQISKFIIDKLGSQVVGQNQLNGLNLTDWIVLGSGNPATSVANFLTKKFFSSKTVQSKIAEILNQNKEVKGPIKPEVTTGTNSSKLPPQSQPKVIKSTSPKGIFNFPNKQGGFINLKAIAKAIDNTDKDIMQAFIEGSSKDKATDLAVKMGLPSAFKGDQSLKNDFIKILDYERAATKSLMDKTKKKTK